MGLTVKQKRFVEEYLIDLNATQAAIRSGYSVKNADKIGPELLGKTRVREYIDKRMKDREMRTEVTQDMVIRELAAIAFSNASDFAKVIEKPAVITIEDGTRLPLMDDDGEPLMVKDVELTLTDNLSPEQKKALSGIKHGKYGIEVASCDKIRALELLGRHLGMFKDKVEISGALETEKTKLDELLKQLKS